MERLEENQEQELFKICHEDGSEWTTRELENWARRGTAGWYLDYGKLGGFYINSEEELILADKYGCIVYVGPPEFNIVWNKKALERLLEEC